MVAHQLASAYELFSPLAAARPLSVLTWKVAMDVMKCGRDQPLSGTKENLAPFACQEKRRRKLHRAFLLPICSLVKCIPDRPMHAGVVVMASRRVASRDIKNPQGPEPSVRPSTPRR